MPKPPLFGGGVVAGLVDFEGGGGDLSSMSDSLLNRFEFEVKLRSVGLMLRESRNLDDP